jgi:hypothetical protein
LGSGSSIECPPTIEAQDLAEHVRPERVQRVGHEVQGADRAPAHRVDVRERVGGGDAPKGVRVVDDRREEVRGLDDREVLGELHHPGVVGGVGRHEHARVGGARERRDDGAQGGGRELAAAAGAVGERGQGGGHALV